MIELYELTHVYACEINIRHLICYCIRFDCDLRLRFGVELETVLKRVTRRRYRTVD